MGVIDVLDKLEMLVRAEDPETMALIEETVDQNAKAIVKVVMHSMKFVRDGTSVEAALGTAFTLGMLYERFKDD